MFARLNQVARHLSRPLPNYLHQSAAAIASPMSSITGIKMAEANGKRTINTAACLIIGDEVLGGKVGLCVFLFFRVLVFFSLVKTLSLVMRMFRDLSSVVKNCGYPRLS